jgi:hypothetical protein
LSRAQDRAGQDRAGQRAGQGKKKCPVTVSDTEYPILNIIAVVKIKKDRINISHYITYCFILSLVDLIFIVHYVL